MEWWQIVIAIVFNVPWLFAFFACVILPAIRSMAQSFDKELFLHRLSLTMIILLTSSAIVLLFALLILLVAGDTMKNPEVLPPTIAISGGTLLISTIIFSILNRRR